MLCELCRVLPPVSPRPGITWRLYVPKPSQEQLRSLWRTHITHFQVLFRHAMQAVNQIGCARHQRRKLTSGQERVVSPPPRLARKHEPQARSLLVESLSAHPVPRVQNSYVGGRLSFLLVSLPICGFPAGRRSCTGLDRPDDVSAASYPLLQRGGSSGVQPTHTSACRPSTGVKLQSA
jgi:hypothetical protein